MYVYIFVEHDRRQRTEEKQKTSIGKRENENFVVLSTSKKEKRIVDVYVWHRIEQANVYIYTYIHKYTHTYIFDRNILF